MSDESITSLPDAAEQLDFLHRVTLPELRRQVEHHQDGKARWRKRAEAAEARVAELEAERADAVGVSESLSRTLHEEMLAGSALYAALTMPTTPEQRQAALDRFTAVAARVGQVHAPSVPVAARCEPEPEFHAWLHHENRLGHDLPETGGTQ